MVKKNQERTIVLSHSSCLGAFVVIFQTVSQRVYVSRNHVRQPVSKSS